MTVLLEYISLTALLEYTPRSGVQVLIAVLFIQYIKQPGVAACIHTFMFQFWID